MTLALPRPIEVYLTSENAHDVAPLEDCMAADAVVIDERRTMRGLAAIKSWRAETAQKYAHKTEPLSCEHDANGETRVTCRITGSFPGSPIELAYVFQVADGRITSLKIG